MLFLKKLGEANWGPKNYFHILFVLWKGKRDKLTLILYVTKMMLVMMKIDCFKFQEFSRFCDTPLQLLK
jgi:hypothetical protein